MRLRVIGVRNIVIYSHISHYNSAHLKLGAAWFLSSLTLALQEIHEKITKLLFRNAKEFLKGKFYPAIENPLFKPQDCITTLLWKLRM